VTNKINRLITSVSLITPFKIQNKIKDLFLNKHDTQQVFNCVPTGN